MTPKLLYIGLTIFILTIVSIMIQSCRDLFTYEGTICTVEFTGINPSSDNSPDKLFDEIGFYVTGHYNSKTCYFPTDFNFISTCNATTKCVKWQNEFLTSSFQISLDRQIVIAGDTVNPNTDLFQKSIFRDKTTIKKDENDCKFVVMTIMLSPDLVSQMTFEQGVYNVIFSCNTSDSRTFTNQRQVIFKQ